ncbi:hypothetical protein SLA2020_446530 [Shorea laevis]
MNGIQYSADNSDSLVIDMDSFSRSTNKDITANSRITRSLSRKGFQRGGEKKISPSATANDRDIAVATSSPRGSSTPEKTAVVAVGTMDNSSNPQVHHQITITTGNITTPTENSLLICHLVKHGTILLIYFTLSIGKLNADEDGLDWQQRP